MGLSTDISKLAPAADGRPVRGCPTKINVRTILVLAEHPELPEAIRAALGPTDYRVVHRLTLEEAEPLLAHGLVQACVLDMDLSSVQGVWLIEKLFQRFDRAASSNVKLTVLHPQRPSYVLFLWDWKQHRCCIAIPP